MENSLSVLENVKLENWQNLPEPLLLTIFAKLDVFSLISASKTCKKWTRLASDFTLVSHLDLTSCSVSIGQLRRIITFAGSNLISLRLKGHYFQTQQWNKPVSHTLNKKVMKKMRNKCPNLKYLYLQNISDDIFLSFLPNSLVCLSIVDSVIMPDCLFRTCNRHQSMQQLETVKLLNISSCDIFESNDCELLNSFISLQYLFLEGLSRINDGGFLSISSFILQNLLVIDLEGTEVKDESLMHLLENCINIQALFLGKTAIVGNLNLPSKTLYNIREVCFYGCDISSALVRNFLYKYPTLEFINVSPNVKFLFPHVNIVKSKKDSEFWCCSHFMKYESQFYKR